MQLLWSQWEPCTCNKAQNLAHNGLNPQPLKRPHEPPSQQNWPCSAVWSTSQMPRSHRGTLFFPHQWQPSLQHCTERCEDTLQHGMEDSPNSHREHFIKLIYCVKYRTYIYSFQPDDDSDMAIIPTTETSLCIFASVSIITHKIHFTRCLGYLQKRIIKIQIIYILVLWLKKQSTLKQVIFCAHMQDLRLSQWIRLYAVQCSSIFLTLQNEKTNVKWVFSNMECVFLV